MIAFDDYMRKFDIHNNYNTLDKILQIILFHYHQLVVMGNKPILAFGDGELYEASGKYTWHRKSTNITTEVNVKISGLGEENIIIGKKIVGYDTDTKTSHEFTCSEYDPVRYLYKFASSETFIRDNYIYKSNVLKYEISSQSAFNGFNITVYKFDFINSDFDGSYF